MNLPRDQLALADDTELGRVFLNLFENARRVGRGIDTGVAEVRLTAQRAGPWAIVSVRDRGTGMAAEKLTGAGHRAGRRTGRPPSAAEG